MDNQSKELWDYLWSHIDFQKDITARAVPFNKIEMEEENHGSK